MTANTSPSPTSSQEGTQKLTRPLSPYERWMVRSNLETARETGVTHAEQAALLHANGYHRIAEAVTR